MGRRPVLSKEERVREGAWLTSLKGKKTYEQFAQELSMTCDVAITPSQAQNWALGTSAIPAYVKNALRRDRVKEHDFEHLAAVSLPVLPDRIAAGPGSNLVVLKSDAENPDLEQLPVPKRFLKPGNEYRLIRLTGHSMSPKYPPGTVILVNFSRTDPRKLMKKLVAAWTTDGAKFKRLFDAGHQWRLHSENPEYGDEFVNKKDPQFQVAAVEKIILDPE